MTFARRRRRHSHIDVAPLVDVVFNLLLFFFITYNVTVDSAIRIKLPLSRTADVKAEQALVISVSREGETSLGDRPMPLDEIPAMIRQSLGDGKGDSVRIKADREAPVGVLVAVMDAVRLAGCSAISIIAERRWEEAEVE